MAHEKQQVIRSKKPKWFPCSPIGQRSSELREKTMQSVSLLGIRSLHSTTLTAVTPALVASDLGNNCHLTHCTALVDTLRQHMSTQNTSIRWRGEPVYSNLVTVPSDDNLTRSSSCQLPEVVASSSSFTETRMFQYSSISPRSLHNSAAFEQIGADAALGPR